MCSDWLMDGKSNVKMAKVMLMYQRPKTLIPIPTLNHKKGFILQQSVK